MMGQLQPHQQRVVEEQKQLHERIEKLTAFLSEEDWHVARIKIGPAEVNRMNRQLEAMEMYDRVLLERIEAWGPSCAR